MADTALAKTDQQGILAAVRQHPIATIAEHYDKLAQVANVTFPATALDNIPAMHKPSPTIVRVSLDQKSKDTYYISSEQQGLSKHVVLKMLAAAGASYRTRKLTPDADLDTIRWTAEVWGRMPDGSFYQAQGSKAWNWEKCREDFVRAARAKNKSEDEGMRGALQYRQFADEQTETKAILRAARAFLNIKTSYTAAELAKPFLFLKAVPDLDTSDPEIKRMLAQKLIDSSFALYGEGQQAPTLPPPSFPDVPAEPTPEEFEEDEPIDAQFHEPADQEPAAAVGAEADPNYDPFEDEGAAAPTLTPEQELDAKLKALAQNCGQRRFQAVLVRNGVMVIRAASFDQKVKVADDCESVLTGRLAI